MDWLVWVIIGIVAAAILGVAIYYVVKVCKMSPDKRKEVIVNFLVGLVTAAELAYNEAGKGSEKLKEVEEAFKKTAPWFLKLLFKVTKCNNIDELIEIALTKAKETWGK